MSNVTKRSRLRNILSIVLLLCLFIVGYRYFASHWDETKDLQLIRPSLFLVVAICFAISIMLRGFFTLAVLRAVDVRLSFFESFSLSMVGTMVNNLLPARGGAGVRGLYLKRAHQLPVAYFASTMAAYFLFDTLVGPLLGLLALLLLAISGETPRMDLIVVLTALAFTSAFIIFLLPSISHSYKGKIAEFSLRILEGWKRMRASKSILLVAVLTSLGAPLSAVVGFYSGFHAFGVEISWIGALLLTSSYVIGGWVTLTPGGVGFQEALGIYFGMVLQIDQVELLSILLCIRLVRVATSVLVGLPCLWRMRRNVL